jgi:hypothetical protein
MYEHSQASRWNSCTSILKPPNRYHTGGLRCHKLLIRKRSNAVGMPTVAPERVLAITTHSYFFNKNTLVASATLLFDPIS